MTSQKDKIYYLLLPFNDRTVIPSFIKECRAKNKDQAIRHFKTFMDNMSGRDTYLLDELVPYIKGENELSAHEKEWIQQLGVIPDFVL